MIIKFIREHRICYKYAIHFQRRNRFLSIFSRSKFIEVGIKFIIHFLQTFKNLFYEILLES